MYFEMQVNLVNNLVAFIGVPFQHLENVSFSIQGAKKPFRIAVSFSSEATNAVGLGIVKV